MPVANDSLPFNWPAIYAALERRIDELRIEYELTLSELYPEPRLAASYDARYRLLTVWRADTRCADDVEREVFNVAHEIGHALSADRGRPAEYQGAVDVHVLDWASALDARQKAIVFAEEQEAWRLGRAELERLGIPFDRERLERHIAESLTRYEATLGLMPAAPPGGAGLPLSRGAEDPVPRA